MIINLLFFNLIVHEDATANVVAIALCHHASHGGRVTDRKIQRPRIVSLSMKVGMELASK